MSLAAELDQQLPNGFYWEPQDQCEVLYDADHVEVGCVATANGGQWQAYQPHDEWPIGTGESSADARFIVEQASGVW